MNNIIELKKNNNGIYGECADISFPLVWAGDYQEEQDIVDVLKFHNETHKGFAPLIFTHYRNLAGELVKFLLLIAFVFAGTASAQTTKLEKKGHFRMVSGTINGEPIKFVFDTGANRTVLSPRLAKKLKLAVTGTEPVNTARGQIMAETSAALVTAAGRSAGIEILITNFTTGAGVEAILGTDFLEKFDFLFDTEMNTLCLGCTLPSEAAAATGTAYDGRFLTRVKIGDSLRLFTIDTGAGQLTVFERKGPQQMSINFAGAGDDITKKILFNFAGTVTSRTAVFLPPIDKTTGGLIPADFFKKLYFEKNTNKFYLYL